MTPLTTLAHKALKITVDEFTSPSPLMVEKDALFSVIRELMNTEGVRHVPVVEKGKPIGIISDRDLKVVECLNGSDKLTAEQIMSDNPFTVTTGTPLEVVALGMSQRKYGSAIVLDGEGKIDGIFTSTDALNALVEILRGEV